MTDEWVQSSPTSQVIRQQGGVEKGNVCAPGGEGIRRSIRRESCSGALRGIGKTIDRKAAAVQAGCIVGRVDNPDLVILIQEGLLIHNAGLPIVYALGVADICNRAAIEKRTLLGDGLPLDIRCAKIVERVIAGVVVEGISPHEAREIEDGIVADGVGPGRRNVKGQDLGALIGWAQRERL